MEEMKYSLQQRQEYLLGIFKAFAALCAKHGVTYYALGGTAIGAVRHQGFIPWDDDIDIFMFREDYFRLRTLADEELKGTNYRIYSCEDDLDYPRPFPSFVDISTEYVPLPLRAGGNPKYLKLGIDLFIFENVPEDEKAFKRFALKAWVLGKLYFIGVTPYPDIPFKNRIVKRLCAAVMYVSYYVFKALPFLRRRVVNSWNSHCARHYGTTAQFALLVDTWPVSYRASKEDIAPPVIMKFEGVEINMARNYDAMLRHDYGDYLVIPPESARKTHPAYRLRFTPKK
jgi:lipopolysaccharide cholinephosphotransferase